MKRNYLEISLGLVVILITVISFIYIYTMTNQNLNEKHYLVKVKFTNVGGIYAGSDVLISGVKVGTVKLVELNQANYMAEVILKINHKIKLPKDSAASILSLGLMGSKFIGISPGSETENLKDGDAISYTQSALNFEDIINKVVVGFTKQKSK